VEDLLSIIVPVYKAEKYLRRCIESILVQSYQNYELILVDDGSPDDSGLICDEYAKKDSRIKSFHKSNGGLSSARNFGLDIAAGIYVGFVDSDDWITPDMYEHLVGLCKKHDVDIASCSYISTADDANTIVNSEAPRIRCFNQADALRFYLQRGISGKTNDYSACTKVYRRELFGNLRFPNGRIYEDMATNFQLLTLTHAYVASEKICYYYYININSITKRGYSNKDQDLLYAVSEILKLSQVINDPLLIRSASIIEARAYFSLLGKILMFGVADKETPIKPIVKDFSRNLRKRLRHIFCSKLSISKKAMALMLCIDYRLACVLMAVYKRFARARAQSGNSNDMQAAEGK
jgi:glycosyltransferase involved in cell wall biosynthesis